MSNFSYEICTPSVVGEVIDGEAIIMNLQSGVYYSADGLGASIWQAIDGRASEDDILQWIAAAFAEPSAGADARTFIGELLKRDLIRVAGEPPAAAVLPQLSGPYRRPVLSIHEDMQDLIQLDPIHDVAEIGWPVRKIEA